MRRRTDARWYEGPTTSGGRFRSVAGMRIVYDRELDIAHVVFDDAGAPGGRHGTVGGIPAGSYVDAEFDAAGRLVGFEVIGATRVLPPEVLAGAEPA